MRAECFFFFLLLFVLLHFITCDNQKCQHDTSLMLLYEVKQMQACQIGEAGESQAENRDGNDPALKLAPVFDRDRFRVRSFCPVHTFSGK